MFDIGLTELLLIGIVALIVVGPKDLPGMFRTLGRVTGKARAMAREFQRAMEQAADDSGVKDMAKDFRDAASPKDFGTDEMKSFTRDPKAWARNAARKSVLKPEDEGDTDAPAQPDTPDTAAVKPETPARPRGPATEALAQARAEAAARRRAEVEAARAGTAAAPETEPQTGAASGPGTERERS